MENKTEFFFHNCVYLMCLAFCMKKKDFNENIYFFFRLRSTMKMWKNCPTLTWFLTKFADYTQQPHCKYFIIHQQNRRTRYQKNKQTKNGSEVYIYPYCITELWRDRPRKQPPIMASPFPREWTCRPMFGGYTTTRSSGSSHPFLTQKGKSTFILSVHEGNKSLSFQYPRQYTLIYITWLTFAGLSLTGSGERRSNRSKPTPSCRLAPVPEAASGPGLPC